MKVPETDAEARAELDRILAERAKEGRQAAEAILSLQTNPRVSFRTRITSLTKLIALAKKCTRSRAEGDGRSAANQCCDMRADLATIGPEATLKARRCRRTEARSAPSTAPVPPNGARGAAPPDCRIPAAPRASKRPGPQPSVAWTTSTPSA